MSFVQLDLDAFSKAYALADHAGIGHAQAIGGLARCWEWCWRRKSINLDGGLIGGFFQEREAAPAIVAAMLATGFLDRAPDGGLTVRDDLDRLGLRKHANRAKGAALARSKKIPAKQQVSDEPPEAAPTNVDPALIEPTSADNQAPINVDRAHQEPESHKAKSQELLLNTGGGRDHAAREAKSDMATAASFADRLLNSFRANRPPGPAPAPPPREQAQSQAETAPPPTSPPISEPWPPEAPPTQSQPPLGKIAAGIENTTESLIPCLGDAFRVATGRTYAWQKFEVAIVGELLALFPGQAILDSWQDSLRDGTAREIKQLKRLMVAQRAENQRPARADPNQGIMMRVGGE